MAKNDPLDFESVNSRLDFARFVDTLRTDLNSAPDDLENTTLERFLEALSAYARDVPGAIRNNQLPVDPERPSWNLFALILRGAAVYE
jgi:hypothetical protein